jgi:hypothetical protein
MKTLSKFLGGVMLGASLMLSPMLIAQTQVITVFPFRAKAITPSDSALLTDFDGVPTAQNVFVSVAGDVVVLPSGNAPGQTVTFTVEGGAFVPVVVKQVLASGTTATGLIGVF